MSDNEIRKILEENKKQMKREEIRGFIEGFAGFGLMFFLGFVICVIGG